MAKVAAKKKTLVIAEKPSVALDIARVLEADQRHGDVYENENYVVASAVGHLVELCMPEDMNPRWKRWGIETLPIVPEKFSLKVTEKTKDKFATLCKLLNDDKINDVINACDSGREGELIFSYIYELSGSQKPFRRLWMVSMTTAGIREAFERLRSADEMRSLQSAARCRSEADWLIGINGTRAVTATMFAGQGVASVGRVQTPTLAMIVLHDRIIRDFKPVPYWRIVARFSVSEGSYEGVYRLPAVKGAKDSGRDRIFSKEDAQRIFEEVQSAGQGAVSEKKKRSTVSPPRLYDLISLQRDANNRFGISATITLKVAQALYEVHKAITYPRTDAKVLPEDYGPVCKDVLKSLRDGYEPLAEKILMEYGIRTTDKQIFNNKEVSDHFAIIPTPQHPNNLNDLERKIYDAIVRRFLGVFFPAAEYDVTTRSTVVCKHEFHSEGRVLAVPGWLEVHGREQQDKSGLLPRLTDEDGKPPLATLAKVEQIEEETKPPPHYTEATLLSAMETAGKLVDDEELAQAMRERGLGTPATRAQIIDNLVGMQYVERDGRNLCATQKAERLLDFLIALGVEALKDPALTGEWECKLRKIEQGQFSRDSFMGEIRSLTCDLVERIRNFNESDASHSRETAIISPTDNQPLLETIRGFVSVDKAINIVKVIGGRKLTENDVAILVRDGRVGPFEDFRSRIGRFFKASVVLESGRAKLEFENGPSELSEETRKALQDSMSHGKPLCKCPTNCGGSVYSTDRGYVCSNFGGGKCNLRIGRFMLGHELLEDEIHGLCEEGKTDVISDFVSNRTGKSFSASLKIDRKGKISFKFPPREKKPAQAAENKAATRPKKRPESTPKRRGRLSKYA
ncbi:MAG: DNA topoisomerase 3 [Puniceicoccales bacterium]|jgi:DNA topoisomerase-3|nr:DNA topoisomerase 3 [Puniceicoccales bacterium]